MENKTSITDQATNKNMASSLVLGVVICPSCDGEGKLHISDCCGAAPRGNGDCDSSDFRICSDCHDHCEYGVDCEECGGKG